MTPAPRPRAVADGHHVALVDATPGYTGGPHEHNHAEFLYVLDGELRKQGQAMAAGGAYAASCGSQHTDFVTTTGARYLTVFKV